MGDVASQLHDAVMNLRAFYEGAPKWDALAYLTGHKEARHAAAELVLTSDALAKLEADRAALLAACKAELLEYDEAYRRNNLAPDLTRKAALRAVVAKAEGAKDDAAAAPA